MLPVDGETLAAGHPHPCNPAVRINAPFGQNSGKMRRRGVRRRSHHDICTRQSLFVCVLLPGHPHSGGRRSQASLVIGRCEPSCC